MSDKWNGKQKGDAEFMPKAEPKPAPSPPPPPGTLTKSVIDGWRQEYRSLLDGPARRYNPLYDLDYRTKYKPRFETATEIRQKELDWERSKGRVYRDMEFAVEEAMKRKMELAMMYAAPMFTDGSKVIAQRIIIFQGDKEAARLDVPTEMQTKLAELFDKAANVPGYMHWWAESDAERVAQVREAAAEIVGALRYDADYWRKQYPDVYDYAAWIARAIVDHVATRIKVETVRSPGRGGIFNMSAIS